MPTWQTATVAEEPFLELKNWEVFEVPGLEDSERERHFMGTTANEPGRVSSRIVSFDPEQRIGTTRSGRTYKLVGPPNLHNPDAIYVLNKWIRIMGILPDTVVNVTAEYTGLEQIHRGLKKGNT